MTIRTVGGNWLIVGGQPAANEACCCDDNPDRGPCESCLDSCVCVVLNGHNFCDEINYSQDDCGGVFEDCVVESWFWISLVNTYFYTRAEYGATDENSCTLLTTYGIALTLQQPFPCEAGLWLGITDLTSSLRESTCDTPPIKDRGWSYAAAIVADSDGCPVSIENGGYQELDSGQPFSALAPIAPVITFLPCPPPEEEMEPFSLASGPGTEIKALLAKIGITATPNCSCNKRAKIMDEKGCDWCEDHIDEIDGWLAEEAGKRKLPYLSLAGRALIRLAVWRSRKKGNSR